MYELLMRDECGGEEVVTFQSEPSRKHCNDRAKTWCKGGSWGEDGAEIDVSWQLLKDDEEIDSNSLTVAIEPDHEALIRKACGNENPCGFEPDDHDWTSEGEGGCSQNPGVWSTGGTGLIITDHCKNCGLKRTEHYRGSQKNPGEHDTFEYEMGTPYEDD